MMLQCEECDSWKLLYSQHKLKRHQRLNLQLQKALEDYTFTCGAPFTDLELPEEINVYSRDITCGEPIEKLYYAAKYPPICVYCARMLSGRRKNTIPNVQTAVQNLK